MNINTAIYVRVSTEEQALNGFSIRAQKEKLMYYATKIKDWNVYKVYSDEGISGKDIKNRPSLQEMLTDIKNKKVNNVSVGLKRGLSVEDLLDVDLTYAPPFSTSVDILHSAARMLKSKIS